MESMLGEGSQRSAGSSNNNRKEKASSSTSAISGKVAVNIKFVPWTMKQQQFHFCSKTVILGIKVQAICKVPAEILKDDSIGLKISISLD